MKINEKLSIYLQKHFKQVSEGVKNTDQLKWIKIILSH